VLNAILGFFTSTRAGIAVMAVLAVLSLLGAIIPQGGSHEAYAHVFGPGWGNLIWYSGLGDVYRSVYYSVLLILLCVMVFGCSLRRLKLRVRQARSRELVSDENRIQHMPCHAELDLDVDPDEAALHVIEICGKRFYRTYRGGGDGRFFLLSSKRGFARYGSFLLHVSFIFLLAGGIAFTRFGMRAYKDVAVGGHFDIPGLNGVEATVNDFRVLYDDSDRVSDYICDITLSEGGRPVLVKRVSPNHPLDYMGHEVFLNSYEQDFESLEGYVLSVSGRDGEVLVPVLYLPFGSPLEVPGANLIVETMDALVPYLRITYPAGEVEKLRLEPDVTAYTNDGNLGFSVVHGVPSIVVTLEVVREPGEWLVITGLVLLTAGSFVCLYLSHRRIWFILRGLPDRKARLIFGGNSSRNMEGFRSEFERIRRTLEELS